MPANAVAAGVEKVLVVGGDGTVSEVARELVYKPGTLGILPIGTFNNIARSIGVPADLPVATNIIATGHESKIDVGLANDTHYFFEAAGAGLDATLFTVGEEIKSGRWTRIVQAARLAFQYQQPFSITFGRPLSEVLPAPKPNADERGCSCRHDYPPQSVAGSGRQRSLLRRRFRRDRRRTHARRATDAFHPSALQQMGAASLFPFDLPRALPLLAQDRDLLR
jgi:hypothetical protein